MAAELQGKLVELLKANKGRVEAERLQAAYIRHFDHSLDFAAYGASSIDDVLADCREVVTSARFPDPHTNTSKRYIILRSRTDTSEKSAPRKSSSSASPLATPTQVRRPKSTALLCSRGLYTCGFRRLWRVSTVLCCLLHCAATRLLAVARQAQRQRFKQKKTLLPHALAL